MKNKIIIFLIFYILINLNLFSWDRFSNDMEYKIQGSYSTSNIIIYQFYNNINQEVTLETKDSNGDTVMYLWSDDEHKQISWDDDGGENFCSFLWDSLKPGNYTVFIAGKQNEDSYQENLLIENQSISDSRIYKSTNQLEIKNSTINNGGNVELIAGNKIVFSQGFHSITGSVLNTNISESEPVYYCSLYLNNNLVLEDQVFSSCKLNVSDFNYSTKFRFQNITDSDQVCGILLNEDGNMIAFDMYDTNYVVAGDKPYYLILGIDADEETRDSCEIYWTEDNNMEFLSLAGHPTSDSPPFNIGACIFVEKFGGGTHFNNFDNEISSRDWMFQENRMDFIDNVDLIFFFGHGSYNGWIQMENGDGLYLTTNPTRPPEFDTSCGNGHKSDNRSGDLKYVLLSSCKTVYVDALQDYQSLINTGWITGVNSNNILNKGFFDGIHIVVGFNTNRIDYTDPNANIFTPLPTYQSFTWILSNNLDNGYSIWNSWVNAITKATDDWHDWYWWDDTDMGEISSIAVYSNKDESIYDQRSKSYKYGDLKYTKFEKRKYHYYY